MKWAGHVARMDESRCIIRVLVGKSEERKPTGRPRHNRGDNIKLDIQEVGCEGIGWIDLSQVRDRWRARVNAAMNFRVP
jgi:hypothetical protein